MVSLFFNYIRVSVVQQPLRKKPNESNQHYYCLHLILFLGCGDAAKIEARASIRTAPKTANSNTQKIKHNYSAKKLNEKIEKMKSDRKPKKD